MIGKPGGRFRAKIFFTRAKSGDAGATISAKPKKNTMHPPTIYASIPPTPPPFIDTTPPFTPAPLGLQTHTTHTHPRTHDGVEVGARERERVTHPERGVDGLVDGELIAGGLGGTLGGTGRRVKVGVKVGQRTRLLVGRCGGWWWWWWGTNTSENRA